MATKKKPVAHKAPLQKSQRERFIETARELGVDATGASFEIAFNRIVPTKVIRKRRKPR